jgi:nicotinate-nucleotide pyrophosphorylase (carboxylating)
MSAPLARSVTLPAMDRHAVPLREIVRRALLEDLGSDAPTADLDRTSRLAVAADRRASARIVAKAPGCLCGTEAAVAAFAMLDAESKVDVRMRDGDTVGPGDVVLQVEGRARALLAAERTALNFLQRLSGVATAVREIVGLLAGTGTRVFDTRKTTPGLRLLEKHAVLVGGGHNHRMGLHDQVLLKENHFALARPVPYEEVVRRCVQGQSDPVVAEASDEVQAAAAVRGGAAVVLLDNFAPGPALRSAVAAVRSAARAAGRRVLVEASGGVGPHNARAFAECGVDRISVGAVTHSPRALDLSLLVEGS